MRSSIAQRALAWLAGAAVCLAWSNALAQCDELRASLQTLERAILDQQFELELATTRVALVEKFRADHQMPSYRADLYSTSKAEASSLRQSTSQKQISADLLRQRLQDECAE